MTDPIFIPVQLAGLALLAYSAGLLARPWFERTLNTPINWTGPLTQPHTASLAWKREEAHALAGQAAAAFGDPDPRPYIDAFRSMIEPAARMGTAFAHMADQLGHEARRAHDAHPEETEENR